LPILVDGVGYRASDGQRESCGRAIAVYHALRIDDLADVPGDGSALRPGSRLVGGGRAEYGSSTRGHGGDLGIAGRPALRGFARHRGLPGPSTAFGRSSGV